MLSFSGAGAMEYTHPRQSFFYSHRMPRNDTLSNSFDVTMFRRFRRKGPVHLPQRKRKVGKNDESNTQGGYAPAVLTVFLIDSIIRLSPEAWRRTFVRSNGLM